MTGPMLCKVAAGAAPRESVRQCNRLGLRVSVHNMSRVPIVWMPHALAWSHCDGNQQVLFANCLWQVVPRDLLSCAVKTPCQMGPFATACEVIQQGWGVVALGCVWASNIGCHMHRRGGASIHFMFVSCIGNSLRL